jgi:hypothetical protein
MKTRVENVHLHRDGTKASVERTALTRLPNRPNSEIPKTLTLIIAFTPSNDINHQGNPDLHENPHRQLVANLSSCQGVSSV